MPKNSLVRPLKVAITIDTDSDFYFGDKGQLKNTSDKTILGWKGLDEGMGPIAEQVTKISQKNAINIPLTWFVRCDSQIQSQFGKSDYLLEQYQSWWQSRVQKGDELQWHAHLYRYFQGQWQQETRTEKLKKDLSSSLAAFKKHGVDPDVIRIGESYHSDTLMALIEELGIKGDSTAMPKRLRHDGEKTIDWRPTPNRPYRPSIHDYRQEGTPHRKLVELPLNTVATQVSYDKSPLPRYVNLAFQSGVLNKGLESFFCEHNVLVSITHPFEVVPDFYLDATKKNHPLLSFSLAAVSDNLELIIQTGKKLGRSLHFVRMSDLLQSELREPS